MRTALDLRVDANSQIPMRRQLTEQLKHAIEAGRVPREQALPSIREVAGLLGINPNTVARVIEDLKRSGHVEARRGKGVFVAASPPARPAPHLREAFIRDVVVRGAALGMTAEDLAVGALSLAGVQPATIQTTPEVLVVECSPAGLDFFARQLEAHLPVRVEKALVSDLARTGRRRARGGRWDVAVTSFGHLPDVVRLLSGGGIPVVALLAEAHLETLHRLALLPAGTRVGVVAAELEMAQNLEHSIHAGLPNVTLVGACAVGGPALGRLVRQIDVVVCCRAAEERVRRLADPALQVIVDDRILNHRTLEALAAVLVQRRDGQDGDRGL